MTFWERFHAKKRELLIAMFTPEDDNAAQLQITSTYLHTWLFSYQINPLLLLAIRFLCALMMFVFLVVDIRADRTEVYEKSPATDYFWALKPINAYYLHVFCCYLVLFKFYTTYPFKHIFAKNKLEYDFNKDFEKGMEPDNPNASKFYFIGLFQSVNPAISTTILVMYYATQNFGCGFVEWHFEAMMITTFVTHIFDNVIMSNYYMNVNHIVVGIAMIVVFLLTCALFGSRGISLYPAMDPFVDARRAIGNTIYLCIVYYLSFSAFYGVARMKQTLGVTYLKTALWFRYEEKRPEHPAIKVTTHTNSVYDVDF